MNIVEHVSLLHAGESSGYMPRSAIAGSSGSAMSNFLRNHQTDFQSGYTSFQFHHQWRSVPISPHPYQHLLLPEFLILAILSGLRQNQRFSLICISMMTKDVEHFYFFTYMYDFLPLQMNLRNALSVSMKHCVGILMGIVLNLQIAFGRIAIFTMLILSTH